MKPLSADDSVGSPHVKVGHRRGITTKSRFRLEAAFFVVIARDAYLNTECDKIAGSDFELRNAGPEGVEGRAPGIK